MFSISKLLPKRWKSGMRMAQFSVSQLCCLEIAAEDFFRASKSIRVYDLQRKL